MRERVHLSGKTLFPGLQAAKAELSACTQVRAVPVQHRPSTTGQDSTAPGIWGVKEGQEKKLAFFFLSCSTFGWGQKAPARVVTNEYLLVSAEKLSNKQVWDMNHPQLCCL